MSVLVRLFNFVGGNPAIADDVDSEFNQILNALNGTSTDKNLVVRYSNATDPPISADQLGAGLLDRWRQSGVDKAKVNNDGSFETVRQFISTLVTGTAPLVVASTTLVANLNADMVDGIQGTNMVRKDDAALQTIISNLRISKSAPVLELADGGVSGIVDISGSSFRLRDGGADLLTFNTSTDVGTFTQIPVGPASNPTTDNQLTRKAYVDAKKTSFSASWFYTIPPGATESVESVGRFNCPPGNTIQILQIRAVFANGSHTGGGNLVWTIKRRNTGGTLQADVGTIQITDGASLNSLIVNVLGGPVTLSDGDQIYPLLTTRGGSITEQNVTLIITGTQLLGGP